jgi:hypothetical protein
MNQRIGIFDGRSKSCRRAVETSFYPAESNGKRFSSPPDFNQVKRASESLSEKGGEYGS